MAGGTVMNGGRVGRRVRVGGRDSVGRRRSYGRWAGTALDDEGPMAGELGQRWTTEVQWQVSWDSVDDRPRTVVASEPVGRPRA